MQTPRHLLVPQLLLLLILSSESLHGQDQKDTKKPILDDDVNAPTSTPTHSTSSMPQSIPPAANNVNQAAVVSPAQLNAIEQRIAKIEMLESVCAILFSVIAFAVSIGLWKRVTKFIDVRAHQLLSQRYATIENFWNAKVDQLVNDFQKNSEGRLNDLMKWTEIASCIDTLRHARRFAEAFNICPWDGTLENLVEYPRGIQRTLLACAGRLKDHELGGKGQFLRAQSWIAVKSIADLTDPSDVTFVIHEALEHCNYSEGIEYYESAKDSGVKLSDDSHRLACVLLRKIGRNKEALPLAKKYVQGAGIRHLNTLASLMRDDGELDGAYDLLKGEVRRELALPIQTRSKGWHRASATFITICYEQNKPLKAVDTAFDLLKHMPTDVGLKVCSELAARCPKGDPKERLVYRIQLLLGEPLHDQAVLARAILKGHRESSEASVAYLQKAILEEEKKLDLEINSSRQPVIRAVIECYKTEMGYQYLHAEKYEDCKAILMELSEEDKFGDAKYCLAQACIASGQDKQALSCIKAAYRTKRKWLNCVRKNPRFDNSELIQQWIRDQTINGSSE